LSEREIEREDWASAWLAVLPPQSGRWSALVGSVSARAIAPDFSSPS